MENIIHELIQENEHLPVLFDIVDEKKLMVPAHWHHDIELVYPLTGSMSAIVQAQKYKLSPGDLLIINSGELHMTRKTASDMTYMILQIPIRLLSQISPGLGLLHFQHFISSQTVEESRLLHESLNRMMNLFLQKKDGYQLAFTARVYDLLFALYEDFSSNTIMASDSCQNRDLTRIIRTVDWIRDNYRTPVSLSEAASRLGLSKEYFCRIFKKYTGQTFLEHLNDIRVSSFYDELRRFDLSIPALMEQNGITNYKTFIRTFKKMYGATPQKIRKR